jgi:DNA-directed RNA polymerase subunit RPC12/RpoP
MRLTGSTTAGRPDYLPLRHGPFRKQKAVLGAAPVTGNSMSHVTSIFAFDARVLLCPQCGAPVHVSAVGGSFTCEYCRSLVVVQPRSEPAPTGQAVPEDQRINELVRQLGAYEDDRQFWPPDFAEVARVGATDENLAHVLAMWQSYCARAKAGDPAAGDFAVKLTAPLSNYFSVHGQDERRRALFESTLEALPSPAQQEIMRCRLSRAALKAGEVDAARAWLASCDPAPLDLDADSEYRVTAAYVATFDQNFERVLTLLGHSHGSIPVAVSSRTLVVMLRANALEKSGSLDEAVATLLDFAGHSDAHLAERSYAAVMKANSWLDLCSQSVPRTIAQLQGGQTVGASAAPGEETHRQGLFGRRKS